MLTIDAPRDCSMDGGFGFVLNPLHFNYDLPIAIAPEVVLDKATKEERERIQKLIQEELSGLTSWGQLFRHEPIPRDIRDSPEWNRILPPRERIG